MHMAPKKAPPEQLAARAALGEGLGYVVPIPYGQWNNKTDAISVQHKKVIKKYWKTVEESNNWPHTLLSFEAWCGMTNYIPGQKGGGPAFQKLMLLLLASSTKPKAEEGLAFNMMWDAENCEYGSMFKVADGGDVNVTDLKVAELKKRLEDLGLSTEGLKAELTARLEAALASGTETYAFGSEVPEEWFEGLHGNGTMLGHQLPGSGTKWRSSGPHVSKHARPTVDKKGKSHSYGFLLGNMTGASDAIKTGGSMYLTSHHYLSYTKHDWLLKCMLQTGTKGGGSVSNTSGGGSVSIGIDTHGASDLVGQCWEVSGLLEDDRPCIPVTNSIAAIFGLYYYPGCDDENDYNWTVQEEVPDVGRYEIRFRCPNPKYGAVVDWYKKKDHPVALSKEKTLYVREPLNAKNKAFLDELMPEIYKQYNSGQTDKISVPAARRNHEFVGGIHGPNDQNENKFALPETARIDQKPETHPLVSPWYPLMYQKEKQDTEGPPERILIGPFLKDERKEWYTHGRDKDFKRGADLHEAGVLVASKPTDHVAFGFRISNAFILYPHYGGGNVLRGNKQKANPKEVGYMTEPKWEKTPTKYPGEKIGLARAVLNWGDWEGHDKQTWRKWLLDPTLIPAPKPKPVPTQASTTPPSFQSPTPDGNGEAEAFTAEVVQNPNKADTIINDVGEDAEEIGALEAQLLEDAEKQVPGHVDSNTDNADTLGPLQMRADRDTVATTFGIPGVSIAETLKECYGRKLQVGDGDYDKKLDNKKSDAITSTDFTDVEIRAMQLKDEKQFTERQKFVKHALEHCGLYSNGLDEGAPKRGNEKQCHWRTARHSPWSHADCYDKATMTYDCVRMDEKAIENYKKKYGSDVNLYLQSEDSVKSITGVNVTWGGRKNVLEKLITAPDTVGNLFSLNLARILAIYFSGEGVGKWKEHEKQQGMLNGLGHMKGSKTNPQICCPKPTKGNIHNWVELWPPVFSINPNVLNAKVKKCLEKYICNRDTTDDHVLLKCLNKHPGWEDELGKLHPEPDKKTGKITGMTVAQWISSPWHLEHLPYQRQHAVFRDGECYSEGCKRCSRTFYEYAYHLYADRTAKKHTFGYAQDLWFREDEQLAPVPLHDPVFWSEEGTWAGMQPVDPGDRHRRLEGGSLLSGKDGETIDVQDAATFGEVERDPNIPREYDYYTGGNMAWPTFKLDPARLHSSDKDRTHVKSAGKMHFRRYINLAYSDEKTGGKLEDADQEYYKGVAQGYMNSGRHKVSFGARDYKVTRSHKYGNVCRDCASLLDRAPGLFVRNNRWAFSGGVVSGNSNAVKQSATDYWTLLFDNLNLSGPGSGMDAFLMKAAPRRELSAEMRKEWQKNFDRSAAALSKALSERHTFPKGWTHLVAQPTIHIQNSATQMETARNEEPSKAQENIESAIKTLNALLDGVDPKTLNLSNPKLRDVVKEAERNLLHNESFARTDHTKQFDSDIKRIEYRNCVVRWKEGKGQEGQLVWLNPQGGDVDEKKAVGVVLPGDKLGSSAKLGKLTRGRYIITSSEAKDYGVYHNCLITQQFDPVLTSSKAQNDLLNHMQEPVYRVEVYLSSRIGPSGAARQPAHARSQWSGDGFVCAAPEGANEVWKQNEEGDGRVWKQVRTQRQSRVFITYSLHRAISSEGQGRVILERMADALYTLFGIDKWLSEMIVFGKMLKSMDIMGQTKDNISGNVWGVIGKTNKNDAMANFYGSRDKTKPRTSYIYDTYETHVDKVEVDAGCEIGPKMGHPHFHLLLTITHYGYVQFDYFKMNTYLELMFKGVDTFHGWGPTKKYPLGPYYLGAPGDPFYGDNENPYVDIKLYPQDNFKEILAAYVRKNVTPSVVEMQTAGRLPGTAEWRRHVAQYRAKMVEWEEGGKDGPEPVKPASPNIAWETAGAEPT